jgi:hypothetical protein
LAEITTTMVSAMVLPIEEAADESQISWAQTGTPAQPSA